MSTHKIHIIAIKRRTGEQVEGTFTYDGLADLWPVETAGGEIVYVSSLDTIVTWEQVAA